MTVKIVPSTGRITALYATVVPLVNASLKSATVKTVLPFKEAAKPRKIWEVITPLLPRAPINKPRENVEAIEDTSSSLRANISFAPLVSVKFMFMPVSPSGTGKTFKASISG